MMTFAKKPAFFLGTRTDGKPASAKIRETDLTGVCTNIMDLSFIGVP
jgi:hypothetical protein